MTGETTRSIVRTRFLPEDLRWLQKHSEVHHLHGDNTLPAFLKPLQEHGMVAFSVFPILLDNKAFAALICARSSPGSMEEVDVQSARQIADQLAIAFSNVQLIEALEQLHWGTLTALARAIDAKSAWTAGHSERVTRMAIKIGQEMGLSSHDLKIMHRGGLLHDIGKIGTPPAILDKPGKLEDSEMEIMREHVQIGLRILEPIPGLSKALPIVAQHHEWFDGSGYPFRLAGESINLFARIFAVADSYDAMISDRPYRQGLPAGKAIAMLKERSGTQFDPRVMGAFLSLSEKEGLTSKVKMAAAGL